MKDHNKVVSEIINSETKTLENESKEKEFITFSMKDRGFVGNSNYPNWNINFVELKGDKVTIQIFKE